MLARELGDKGFLRWRNSYHQGKGVRRSSYRVWQKNAEFVRKQNSLGLSYTVAMNEFGHMVITAWSDLCVAQICHSTPTSISYSTIIVFYGTTIIP